MRGAPGPGIIKSATSRHCQAAAPRGPERACRSVGSVRRGGGGGREVPAAPSADGGKARQRGRERGRARGAFPAGGDERAPRRHRRRGERPGPRAAGGSLGGSRAGLTCWGRSLQEPPRPGLACRKRVRSSPWRRRAPPRTDTRPPRKASRRRGPAPGPRRAPEAGARRRRPATRTAPRATRSTPARTRRTRGRCGRGPTGAPPLFRGRLLLAPRGGGRGGRAAGACSRPAARPLRARRAAASAGVCRSLLGRLWRRPGAARAGPGGGRPGRRSALGPGAGAGLGLRGAAWAELARAPAAASLPPPRPCGGRSHGLNAVSGPRKPRVP